MKKILAIIVCICLFHCAAFADGYWLELKGNHRIGDMVSVTLRYGGVNDQKQRYIKTGKDLNKMKEFLIYMVTPQGHKEIIPIKQSDSSWSGYFIPKENGHFRIFGIDSTLPVVERKDSIQNIKPIQYVCTEYQVGQKNKKQHSMQDLDICTTIKNNIANIDIHINGKSNIQNASLRIFLPDNHDITIPIVHNKAIFNLTQKGMYIIRIDDIKKEKGTINHQNFYAIRQRCDYTLYNP